jgi:intracellular sulfur oxidation DsrE/DsrF family protein
MKAALSALVLTLGVFGFSTAAVPSPAHAQAVVGYGAFSALPDAGEQPDAERLYRVIVDVAQGGPDDQPLKSLDRVARLTNLLDAGGVTGDRRKIVAVLHGGATLATLSDAAWAARGKGEVNPNSALIRSLVAAGVQVRLCGQSMVANGLTPADLEPAVQVDLAAMMTVIHHQQAGYALIL